MLSFDANFEHLKSNSTGIFFTLGMFKVDYALSCSPEPLTCDVPDQYVFESYYHGKFWAYSSKINRVMTVYVHDPPLTLLNPHL